MSNDFDVNKIATDLNGKADMDLTNTIGALSASSKNYFSGLGMPSNRYVDLELGAAGTTYTAPANGYYVVNKRASASGQFLFMGVQGSPTIRINNTASFNDSYIELFLPVSKGSNIVVDYNLGGATSFFVFIYAQGESEE